MRICPDPFKECARRLRSLAEHHGHKIIREIKNDESYATIYRLACDMIGVKNSVEIAILVTKLPLNWGFSRLKGLLGLVPHKNKNYNHRLRAHLSRIAMNIYFKSIQPNKVKPKILEDLVGLPRKKVVYMLQLRILKILKRAWQQQRQYSLAGEQ